MKMAAATLLSMGSKKKIFFFEQFLAETEEQSKLELEVLPPTLPRKYGVPT